MSGSLVPIISAFNQLFLLTLILKWLDYIEKTTFIESQYVHTLLFPPTNKCLPSLHPLILRNSSNSSTLREQQLQPLDPSWKIGAPGWWKHAASEPSPLDEASSLYVTPQPRLLQVVPTLTGTLRSSSSGRTSTSKGLAFLSVSSAASATVVGVGVWFAMLIAAPLLYTSIPSLVVEGAGESGLATGAGCTGFSSVWRPLVQPGMLRNSSKSETRFLQHDQPFKPSWKTGAPEWYWQAVYKQCLAGCSNALSTSSLYTNRCRCWLPPYTPFHSPFVYTLAL